MASEELSPRERQVAADTHRMHVLQKMGVRNAVELARQALRESWPGTEL